MPDDQHSRDVMPATSRRALSLGGILVAIVVLVVLVAGIAARVAARQRLHDQTSANAIPTVSVVHPTPVGGTTLVLPARLDAWYQAPVYAQTNGYLRKWYVDIGSTVHTGQVLAEIETPEVDQQLAAARAALATANAQLALAATTATRWTRLLAQNAVSKQETDDRTGDYAARLAMRNEAQANVDRLLALTGFKQLVAPFAGVVTTRSTDIGALIVSGPGGSAPLFTVADISRLRVYVSVPQADVAAVHVGLTATFTVPELPGRHFTATLTRTARAVDPQSGAMLVQLVYDNADGLLKPGGYADITLDLPTAGGDGLLRVPADTLLFRAQGTTVAVADADGRVTIHPVTIATDLGTELEISSGLSPQDWVIDSPNDGIGTSDRVHPTPRKPNRNE